MAVLNGYNRLNCRIPFLCVTNSGGVHSPQPKIETKCKTAFESGTIMGMTLIPLRKSLHTKLHALRLCQPIWDHA